MKASSYPVYFKHNNITGCCFPPGTTPEVRRQVIDRFLNLLRYAIERVDDEHRESNESSDSMMMSPISPTDLSYNTDYFSILNQLTSEMLQDSSGR